MSCKTLAKLRLELTPSFDAVSVVRNFWESVDLARGLSEAVHSE